MKIQSTPWFAVLVAGLGYFVDVFDLWLFSNVRVASLKDLGLSGEDLTTVGARLINCQQVGLLLGGLIWGVLGDKRGRATVMFGSIVAYSLANLLNGFVTSIEQYQLLRFLAGFGLAGEIGAGITLVAELLPKKSRGVGITLVTGLGVSGGCFAAIASQLLDWRTAYIFGGCMGLSLLFLRYYVHESGMFSVMSAGKDSQVKKGSVLQLFTSKARLLKLVCCSVIGVPLFLQYGLFAPFAPEIASGLGIKEAITVAEVVTFAVLGLTLGDFSAGFLSQWLQSRKLAIGIFLFGSLAVTSYTLLGFANTKDSYIVAVSIASFFGGSWACLILTAAESFGTNLRATVTTFIPNLMRSSTILLTSAFIGLKSDYGVPATLWFITISVYLLAFLGLLNLKETFNKDLDYYET